MIQYRYQLERYRESPTQRHSERTKRAWESPTTTSFRGAKRREDDVCLYQETKGT